jgi:hypothetical protein
MGVMPSKLEFSTLDQRRHEARGATRNAELGVKRSGLTIGQELRIFAATYVLESVTFLIPDPMLKAQADRDRF